MRPEEIIAKALEVVDNDRYVLSALVSKRTKELINGDEILITSDKKSKFVDIALKEIAEGKISYSFKD